MSGTKFLQLSVIFLPQRSHFLVHLLLLFRRKIPFPVVIPLRPVVLISRVYPDTVSLIQFSPFPGHFLPFYLGHRPLLQVKIHSHLFSGLYIHRHAGCRPVRSFLVQCNGRIACQRRKFYNGKIGQIQLDVVPTVPVHTHWIGLLIQIIIKTQIFRILNPSLYSRFRLRGKQESTPQQNKGYHRFFHHSTNHKIFTLLCSNTHPLLFPGNRTGQTLCRQSPRLSRSKS
ncbi:unknown [Odoribacter splanchnicus CAG:14]|nr:unknown [Odoribacter splanchnicus CAG:14]